MSDVINNTIATEIHKAKTERDSGEKELLANMKSFAEELKSSMGTDIRQTLTDVQEERLDPKKKKRWLKNFLTKIIRTCS